MLRNGGQTLVQEKFEAELVSPYQELGDDGVEEVGAVAGLVSGASWGRHAVPTHMVITVPE